MWRGLAVFALGAACAGCGRIGFDPIGGGGDIAGPIHSTLVLDRFDAGEVLLDFPLMIIVDSSRADLSAMAPDRSDLRVQDADGALLPVEIDSPDPAVVAYVRVPRIEGRNTTLTLSYGDPSAPAPSGSAWPPAYEGVFHFTTDLRDSTGKNVAMPTGTSIGEGFRGSGCIFDSANQDVILIQDHPRFAFTRFTISGLMLFATQTSPYTAMVSRELADSQQDDLFLGAYNLTLAANIATTMTNYGGGTGTAPVSSGSWHHLAVTFDAGELRGYVDGTLMSTYSVPGSPIHTAAPIMIGAGRNNSDATNNRSVPDDDFLDGSVDEIAIQSTPRSTAWITAENYAIGDAWITYGPIER